MSRQEFRARAERVVPARAVLRTPWRDIMRTEGFKSVGAVQNTYYRELARRKQAPKALADLTAQEILVRRDATTQIAVAQLIEARRVGDIAGVATMMREIRQNDVETAKMLGLYEPGKVDVNLTQSLPALIADVRQTHERSSRRRSGGNEGGNPMTAMTKRDAVDAALSVAQDAAEGRLDLTALQEQAVAECRALFGTVAGPGDALWGLQVEVRTQCVGAEGNSCRRADRVAGCGAPANRRGSRRAQRLAAAARVIESKTPIEQLHRPKSDLL
jgi:hypothetical protein